VTPRGLDAWLTYIEHQHPVAMHFGLERIQAVIEALGLQQPAPVVITVAGTNGKGSTVALLEGIYRAAGYRTGAYTSPHLRRFNERVRIDGEAVDDASLCAAFEAVERARGDVALTYFEFATAAALVLLKRRAVDVALLEVGLGGRLDAVNAVDSHAAAVVSIGLDHTEWLGPTLEDIGWEKAHVYRRGRPAICAQADPPARLLEHARAIGADLRLLGRDFCIEDAEHDRWHWSGQSCRYDDLPVPAGRGLFQRQNAAAALALVESLSSALPVSVRAVRSALGSVRIEGRAQVREGPVTWVFDVAHNEPAAQALAQTLGNLASSPTRGGGAGKTRAVFGIMRDKDVAGVVSALAPVIDQWFTASPPSPRGLEAARAGEAVREVGGTLEGCFDTVAQACQAARAASAEGDRIVVFGSFLIVGPGLQAVAPDEA
jgi:dihydrofolate synthase/folylpolyglutamate synthase